MKFDINNLKNLNELDFEQVAIWPFEVKTLVALLVAICVGFVGYYLLVKDQLPILDSAKQQEIELKQQFEAKYRLAANLGAYKQQLAQIKLDFSSMLKSLPTRNETPGLLDDITLVGTSSGLTFKLLNWQQESPKEFYTELPIQLIVTGNYHEFGEFVSQVAALPRIVTLHDMKIEQDKNELKLELQAKTYRAQQTELTE
jgi:type IV pilus assembly protein PilO